MDCPKCAGKVYFKDGKVQGRQRYLCKGCKYRYTVKQRYGRPSCFDIKVYSLRLYELLIDNLHWKGKKNYSVCLRHDINNYSKEFLFGFARGLMDTDGCVDRCNLIFTSISKNLTYNLRDIFLLIGIQHTDFVEKRKAPRNDQYKLRVLKKGLILYSSFIGFSNPRKQIKLLEILNKKG